jgi:hypothetical protein
MDMRKNGVALPDTVVVQSSNLARKADIIDQMQAAASQQDPLTQAKADLLKSQATLTNAKAVESGVTGMFSATQAANQIAAVPAVAPLADQLLQSAGFVDQNAAPIIPQPGGGAGGAPMPGAIQPATHPAPAGLTVPQNTSPNFPPHPVAPDIGAGAGIERQDAALAQPR